MGRDERMIRDGLLLGLLALAAVSPCWESGAQAGFHDGGVAGCANCHIMHDQDVGGPGGPGGNLGPAHLVDGPASDLCLNCHANNYGAVMSSDPLNPAPERGPGNFGFLLANNINDGSDGIANPISGDHAGHNINAPGFGLSPDGTYQTSPGGTFPTMKLGCTSCHDPHGNENYRLLRGPGMAGIGVFVSAALLISWKDLLLNAFDPAQARAIGLPVKLLHYGLLTILSLTIVATLKAVGLILAIGLLIAPGAIAFLITRQFRHMLIIATLVSTASLTLGVYLSFFIGSDPGPTVILVLAAQFIIAFTYRSIRNKTREAPQV